MIAAGIPANHKMCVTSMLQGVVRRFLQNGLTPQYGERCSLKGNQTRALQSRILLV